MSRSFFLKEKGPKRTLPKQKKLRKFDRLDFLSFSFLRRFFLFTEEKKAAKENSLTTESHAP